MKCKSQGGDGSRKQQRREVRTYVLLHACLGLIFYGWVGLVWPKNAIAVMMPCPSPPPSNSALGTEKWALESLTDKSSVLVF